MDNLEARFRRAHDVDMEPLPFEARPINLPLLVSLLALQIAGGAAFLWAIL